MLSKLSLTPAKPRPAGDSAGYFRTERQGEYFRGELGFNNEAGAVWAAVTNWAVLAVGTNDVATNAVGQVFVPRTPEAFQYDADGNLLTDGRWTYTWDAENRLVQVESRADTPQASRRKVEWQYDALGRRIRQTTSDGSSGSWVVTEDLKFVSDPVQFGRHIAELNATNNALVRSYVWGLDLSGSLDGAGGVGGLLMVTSHSTPVTCHFAAYDGNGNVAALVNASTGSETARYEYGPFGEPLRLTGPAARENPFRFSTKRTDDTTDLVLYEYRVYNPSIGRWPNRDPIGELGTIAMMIEAKDIERIKRVLPASPEARHLLLQNTYYRRHISAAHPRLTIGAGRTADTLIVPLYGFVHNDPIQAYDRDGQVAQWLAACGVGACWGGIGGFFGGLGGGLRGATCGAFGGAVNGCCSGIICTTLPQFCTIGSCLCGALGSFAQQMCEGGFNYRDKCAWASLILSAGIGCLGGLGEGAEDAQIKILVWVTGVDIASITTSCPGIRDLLK